MQGIPSECERAETLGNLNGSEKYIFYYWIYLNVAPMLASYADDYPHGKFYVTCVDKCENLNVETLDLPLESVVGGKKSFSTLDFPDNFFDRERFPFPENCRRHDPEA